MNGPPLLAGYAADLRTATRIGGTRSPGSVGWPRRSSGRVRAYRARGAIVTTVLVAAAAAGLRIACGAGVRHLGGARRVLAAPRGAGVSELIERAISCRARRAAIALRS